MPSPEIEHRLSERFEGKAQWTKVLLVSPEKIERAGPVRILLDEPDGPVAELKVDRVHFVPRCTEVRRVGAN